MGMSQQQKTIAAGNIANQQNVQGFAQPFMNAGVNALNGQVPGQFIAPSLQSINSGFAQNRQNLMDFMGQSGQGFGSGISSAPIMNSFQQQAVAAAQAKQQAQMGLIGLGFQGAGATTGSNQNPQSFSNPFLTAFGGGLGQGLGSSVASFAKPKG